MCCQEHSEAVLGEMAGGVVSGWEGVLVGEGPVWCSSATSVATEAFEATTELLLLAVVGESLLSCVGAVEE